MTSKPPRKKHVVVLPDDYTSSNLAKSVRQKAFNYRFAGEMKLKAKHEE